MQYQRIFVLLLSATYLRQNVYGSIIVHGNQVGDNAMQYMASVQSLFGHVCGGFLVSENFVLTAAHCYNDYPVRVVLGNHNLQNPQNGQTIDIDKKFKHPFYTAVGTGNDLMLLKLKEKAVLGNGVQIIQLPTANMNVRVNDICQVAGWGATKTKGGNVKNLMVTDVSIIDLATCATTWGGLPQNIICAGGYNTGKGFCQGDSGGPLVCRNIAVGVVSFNRHSNCNYKNEAPNVFVDISKYLDWILNTISYN